MQLRLLDPAPDAPAARLAPQERAAFDDPAALAGFAAGLDLATYEFENVPVVAARALAGHVPVYPPPQALEVAQDRVAEKCFFQSLGAPTPRFATVDTRADLDAALVLVGWPAVLKTRRLGYDGKGQALLRSDQDADRAWDALAPAAGPADLILERFVSFRRELSLIAARGRDGATAFYPLVENTHRDGILRRSIAPAPGPRQALQEHAEQIAARALEALDYVGVLAIELFDVGDEQLLVNEMAPRVHNSGHWTIEGAETSQFEQHMRAIAGLPLGETAMRGYAAMVNLIGAVPDAAAVLAVPGAHLHLYEKAPRPGRKLGHITVRADTPAELARRLALVERTVDGRER
jgi:5-(carboxyamino)imidazole ribonucleotide synthase